MITLVCRRLKSCPTGFPGLSDKAVVVYKIFVHNNRVHTFANVATRVFNSGVAIDVGEQAQAEAVLVVGWVSESINQHAGGGSVVSLSYTIIQLIVHNRAPVTGLLILHWLHI